MGRIIKPLEIMEQANSIIAAIDADIVKLNSAMIETYAFINSEEVEGKAWSNVKMQIESHNTVIRGLICMLEEMIIACNGLKLSCGEEDLNEDTLGEQKRLLENENFIFQNILYNYTSQYPDYLHGGKYSLETEKKEYIYSQISLYNKLICCNEEEIQEISKKLLQIEEIDAATKVLTERVEELQVSVSQGIQYLKSTWNTTTKSYVEPIGAATFDWVQELNYTWHCRVTKARNPELFTYIDAEMLELSRKSDKVYLSCDKQSLFYGGVKYTIYVPPQDGNHYFEANYETVHTIEDKELDFNAFKALLGIEFEDPDLQPVQNNVQTLYTPQLNNKAASVFVADAIIGGLAEGFSQVDIRIEFQTANGGSLNRAIIYAGTSEQRINAEYLNYGAPISMYSQNYHDPLNREIVSDAAYNTYNERMGGDVERKFGDVYDFEAVLSEERRNAKYFSYLSFDSEGNMIEKPIQFTGERIYITKSSKVAFRYSDEVWDLTEEVFGGYSTDTSAYENLFNENVDN